MGWPMALNLRKSLPSETVLYIYDVRESVCDALHEHVRAGAGEPDSNNTVVICANAREVACNCVRTRTSLLSKLSRPLSF